MVGDIYPQRGLTWTDSNMLLILSSNLELDRTRARLNPTIRIIIVDEDERWNIKQEKRKQTDISYRKPTGNATKQIFRSQFQFPTLGAVRSSEVNVAIINRFDFYKSHNEIKCNSPPGRSLPTLNSRPRSHHLDPRPAELAPQVVCKSRHGPQCRQRIVQTLKLKPHLCLSNLMTCS